MNLTELSQFLHKLRHNEVVDTRKIFGFSKKEIDNHLRYFLKRHILKCDACRFEYKSIEDVYEKLPIIYSYSGELPEIIKVTCNRDECKEKSLEKRMEHIKKKSKRMEHIKKKS